MAGKDKIDPKANEWMEREGLASAKQVMSPDARKRVEHKQRQMAAQIQRIARRLGKKPEDLAGKVSADTVRRLKYPVLEQRNPDGTRTFEHDLGIKTDGRLHT